MRYLLNTEIGLMGIWDSHSFDFVVDKKTYDETFVNDNDLVRVMNEKGVVVWGVGGDGKSQ